MWGAALLAALACLGGPVATLARTHQGRPGAVAEILALNDDLLAHDSATAVLQQWCADHRLAADPKIVAERVRGKDKPASTEARGLLRAEPSEVIAYRRVRLVCGTVVLSEADNWYRPDRLTADMNRQLDTTDTPFGAVVRSLGFHRERLSARVLVSENDRAIPAAVIRHKALLETPDGEPFSLVVETYLRAAVDAP